MVKRQEYDDLTGCIIQSLNDKFADYCYTKIQVSCVEQRLRREGKTSAIAVHIKEKDFEYWQIVPVKLYKKCGNGNDMELRKMLLPSTKIPAAYKCEYRKAYTSYIIKDYGSPIDENNLLDVLDITNAENL